MPSGLLLLLAAMETLTKAAPAALTLLERGAHPCPDTGMAAAGKRNA